MERLQTIPGVGRRTAEVLLAEIGDGSEPLPQCAPPRLVGRAVSRQRRERGQTPQWAHAQRQSVAAHRLGRSGPGRRAHQRDLSGRAVSAAWRTRRGAKRAAVAVAHTILVMVYALLTQEVTYHELGGQYFDERDRQAVAAAAGASPRGPWLHGLPRADVSCRMTAGVLFSHQSRLILAMGA